MEYRDIHGKASAVLSYQKLINDSSMSSSQKKDIERFISDLTIGKAGKKVKDKRLLNYLQFLLKMHDYFKIDFSQLTEKRLEQFYKDLQENKIKRNNGMPYAQASKDEFIKTLKRFLGWKWGRENKKYQKGLSWMKEDYKGSDKTAITFEDCKKVIAKEKSLRNKALFIFLFDSGARIEEALNIRLIDLKESNGKEKFFIVHLRGQKTDEADRTIPLPLATTELKEWLQEHPQLTKEDFLFPIQYDNARKITKEMSERVLKIKIKPHELRHSSATHYIQYGGFGAENIGGFYYRYGWKFGSKEALTYIKTYLYGGEVGQKKVVEAIWNNEIEGLKEIIEKLDTENKKLTQGYVQILNRLDKIEKKKNL